MTHADLLSFPLLSLAIPAGTVLGIAQSGPGLTLRVALYELCLRLAFAGVALVVAILTQGLEGAAGASVFAAIPVGLLLLEVGWATTSPFVCSKND